MEVVTHRNYLEVVLYLPDADVILPGGYVSTENTYFTIQTLFQCDKRWESELDMIDFFNSLSKEQVQGSISKTDISESTSSRRSLAILDTLRKASLTKVKKIVSKERDENSDEDITQPFIFERIKRLFR
ncbi:transient receptor potential cation channel subfamily M member 2 [Caerostris extrusa]|uniref:Transient receptor potential cation channel subfamily M member 2 n=1 Tax=Caerostris extrusa TaxID=172846 RepID=A0AAV4V7R3_CAEEX|nr:transient receptor potential cation channel subfamily M member 2 [Caerostris extrusa]